MRVLIADDQPTVGSTMALLVAAAKHHVVKVVCSGMEAIRAYHTYKGNARKTVIVPDSAHGTNPASAMIAGSFTSALTRTETSFPPALLFPDGHQNGP